MGSFESQDLPRAVVELVLQGFELLWGDGCQVHALWQIAPQESDDVLYGSLLP